MKSIKTKIIVTVILCSLVSTFICGAISIVNSVSTSYEDSQREMQLKCVSQSSELDTMMQNVSQSVEMVYSIAVAKLEHAASFRTSKDYVDTYTKQMLPILMQSAQNTKGALTAYIRYNPEFTEPTSGLFLTRNNSDSEFESVTPTDFSMYDPSDVEHVGWYYIPVQNGKETWMEPYLNSNIGVYMISYVIPLFDNSGTAVGIIGMDIAMSRITAMVDEIKLYDTGYAFLCDSKGDMVYHNRYPNGMTLEEIKKNSLFTFIDGNYSGEQAGDVINIRNSEGEKRKLCAKFLSNGMAVVISVADKEIGRKRISVMIQDAFAVAVVLIVTSLLTFKFTSIIVKPIKHLTEVSKKIAAGDLDVEIECKTKDEIGVLASRYSDTVKMLKKYINKINKQAYTDAATDVGNKAAYHDAVQRIDKMSQHANGDYAIFVMDINYLKMYNDKYGHEFGDMLISDASTIIKRVFGDYNIYRIGGDEFTVIINSPGNDLCEQLVKRFKQEQELFNRNAKHYELGVRIAVGYAVNDASDRDYADVFNRADRQMYLDKQEIKKTARATDYVDNR